MPGKHASPDNSQFYRDVVSFVVRWFLGAIIVFGGAWLLTTQVFGGDESSATTLPVAATTSTEAPTTSAVPVTVAAPITTVIVTPPATEATATTAPAPATTLPQTTTTLPATTTTLGPELAPGQLTVRVLNSTGRNGLAAQVTSDLAALGYIMRTQDNYSTPLSTTTVFYVPGLGREAQTLASQLPGDTITEVNPAAEPSADLLVVLGSSYP